MQGIYRVNGVKTRVEKLCQVFENGKELVELSQCSPHDISNVLKLYLRQVGRWRIFVLRNQHSSVRVQKSLYFYLLRFHKLVVYSLHFHNFF